MDNAIWITWYDLPAMHREVYLSWVHDTYIPQVVARAGVSWAAHYAAEPEPTYAVNRGRPPRTADASVPGGTRFMLLFGADTPHAFVNPTVAQFHAGLPHPERSLLGLRMGVRSNIMIEQACVLGPEDGAYAESSPCIQLGSYNSASYQDEDELADWHAQWNLASCEQAPGCVRARKWVSVSGWAKHAMMIEFESLTARNRHFVNYEAAYPDKAAWTEKVARRLIHAPGSPSVARRIWPPSAV